MKRMRAWIFRFGGLFHTEGKEKELAAEMDSHLQMQIEDNLRSGMTSEQARREAIMKLGGVEQTKQAYRERSTIPLLENLLLDLSHVLRQFRNSPRFALTATLTLAVGIGATTAIFSVVDGVLLRPMPFREPGRIVILGDRLQGVEYPSPASSSGVTAPDIRAYTRDTHVFSSLGGYKSLNYELSGNGEPARINASRLSAGVFSTLGVSPLLGRVFTQREDDDGQQVMVLSYSIWKTRFRGDASILGKKLLLDRKPYIVIGVMPRNFEFPLLPGHLNQSQIWAPLSLTPAELTAMAGVWGYQMIARLKPGITPAQAQTDADGVAREIMRNSPAFMSSLHISAFVRPLREATVGDARPLVGVLFLAVVLVLLIACANLAGLLLVRAIRRRHETALRLALGSSAATLVRQSILESLSLSITGGLLGIGLAVLALRGSIHLLPETLPRIDDISLNWVVVVFALFLAIATGVLSALAPAFAAIHTNMSETLKEGGRAGSVGGGHSHLRSTLVIAEIAVALILLISSGLLLRSFQKMRDVDLGFRPANVITASYTLPEQRYATQFEVDTFNHELLRRLGQLPSVGSAGLATFLPPHGVTGRIVYTVDGYVPPKGAAINIASAAQTKGDYFRAMGIPLLRGRLFTGEDNAKAQLVVIVNRKLAAHYWPRQSPLGKRLRIGTSELKTPWLTVVGEVADIKQSAPDGETSEQFYQPIAQFSTALGALAGSTYISGTGMSVALRAAIPPEKMENSLREVFHSLDPQLAVTQVQSMEQVVSSSEAPRRFNTTVITAFALAAVLLAILGIYSVIAFTVASRTQEVAIRMALGSSRSGVVRLVLISAARLAVIGCLLGLAGAVAASHLLRSLLFQVKLFDPLVLIAACAVILMLSLIAAAMPARRASMIDPMLTMRAE